MLPETIRWINDAKKLRLWVLSREKTEKSATIREAAKALNMSHAHVHDLALDEQAFGRMMINIGVQCGGGISVHKRVGDYVLESHDDEVEEPALKPPSALPVLLYRSEELPCVGEWIEGNRHIPTGWYVIDAFTSGIKRIWNVTGWQRIATKPGLSDRAVSSAAYALAHQRIGYTPSGFKKLSRDRRKEYAEEAKTIIKAYLESI